MKPLGLRIAFFGSDAFSLQSLEMLHRLRNKSPEKLSDILLVTRRLKPSGRGLKTVNVPLVAEFAQATKLQWTQVESEEDFIRLRSERQLDMAIAVSYGKLIPSSFLSRLKYGGLNVHPSLLPAYRGAAPLQRAIMDCRPYTGVSVQTLHPTRFDRGELLWQSSQIPLEPRETFLTLRDKLGSIGAVGLKHVLEGQIFPGGGGFRKTNCISHEQPSCARLIDAIESRINFAKSHVENDAIGRALGRLWFEQIENRPRKHVRRLRVLLSDFVPVNLATKEPVGTVKLLESSGEPTLALRVRDGYVGARSVTISGYKRESAADYFEKRDSRWLGPVCVEN